MTSVIAEPRKQSHERTSSLPDQTIDRLGVSFRVPAGAVVVDTMRDLGWQVDLEVMVMRPSHVDEKARLRLFINDGACYCEVRFYDGTEVLLDERAFSGGNVVIRTLTRKEESEHYQKWPVHEGLLSPFRYVRFHRQCSAIRRFLDERMEEAPK